jgi:hypothetical protein
MYAESIALQQTRTGFPFCFDTPKPRFTLYGVMLMQAGRVLNGRWGAQGSRNCRGGDEQGSTGYQVLGLPLRVLWDDACAQVYSHDA